MQDGIKKGRGRPRSYDREAALGAMMQLFWRQGYSATSLDELSAATGMKRPSLYQAFGSKADMYDLALAHFIERMAAESTQALFGRDALEEALVHFYYRALDTYFEETAGLGCMVFCSAVAETRNHPGIEAALQAVIDRIDAALKRRFRQAKAAGQLPARADVASLAVCRCRGHRKVRSARGPAIPGLRSGSGHVLQQRLCWARPESPRRLLNPGECHYTAGPDRESYQGCGSETKVA